MKVLVLEHPRIRSEKYFNEIANAPLLSSLLAGYAAASIQSCGCEVELLNANTKQWDFEATLQGVMQRNPELICVHAVYFWEHTAVLFDFLNNLRKCGFSGHINLFGFFPTLAYVPLLENIAAIDSITVGECEHTMAGLVIRLEWRKNWREIPGLAARDNQGRVLLLPRPPEPNPDLFSFPLRQHDAFDTAGVLASRGCYNQCRFCSIPAFYRSGPAWRGRRPEMVVKEIRLLKAQGVTDIYFLDPNFIGPGKSGQQRTRVLCQLLKPLGISFGMETRVNDLSAELLEELRAAGLNTLLLGIESGSSSVLEKLEKHGSVATAETAITLCRNAGIEPEIGFLMFVPDSTVSDLSENFDFLKRNELLTRLDRTANLLSHQQIIFWGTVGYRIFKKQNRITPTGPLGFVGEAVWADAAVEWMSHVIRHAALLVLTEIGNPTSSLFWEKQTDWSPVQGVNDYLVNLFERCLKMVNRNNTPPKLTEMKHAIEKEIIALLTP